jgi:uncharacterized protein YecE (DUF72 family)
MSQLGLFGDPTLDGTDRGAVRAADVSSDIRTVAASLPSRWRFGTSSWSFPGWRGSVWGHNDAPTTRTAHGGLYSEQTLAKRGLQAYASHPLLRTVGVDRTHYAPVGSEVLAQYANSVPNDFRFLVKAHEACSLAMFPSHPRYGEAKGQRSPHFLDAGYARDVVVAPFVEGLGSKAGVLLFQFAAQPIEQLGGSPRKFAEMLYRFLRDLPKLPRLQSGAPSYAVELRNSKLLTADYAAALRSAGVVHCFNVLPAMPSLSNQRSVVGDQAMVVARWMLAPHHSYETALAAYGDFTALVDRDRQARREIADLLGNALANSCDALVIVNNKAEGSSPLSIFELAAELRDQLLDQPPF